MMQKWSSLVLVLCGLVAGVALALDWSPGVPKAQEAGPADAPSASARFDVDGLSVPRVVPQNDAQVRLSYAPIVEQASPAVVNIFTAKRVQQRQRMRDPFFDYFFGGQQGRGGMSQERIERSLGSGVVVSADGLVVTNKHVVGDADEIRVVLSDRREFAARLIVSDDRSDLALIQLEKVDAPLPVLPLGNSDDILVGDLVLAIGNPFGVGQTVTSGIVSALRSGNSGPTGYQYYIQTDAAINPGNSGGALISMDGRLIGINTFIFSQTGNSVGIGFAVPVNLVRTVINASETGTIARPWLGAQTETIDSDLARTLNLERPAGVLVNSVRKGSPAAKAGVQAGDVIFAVDGKEVSNPETLNFQIATKSDGATTSLTVIRKGKAQVLKARLALPPEDPPRDVTTLSGEHVFAGLNVANLSPAFARELNQNLPEEGVVVLQVSRTAIAARMGLVRPGDIIESLDGGLVRTVDELEARLAADPNAALRFGLIRGGQRGTCEIRSARQFGCQ